MHASKLMAHCVLVSQVSKLMAHNECQVPKLSAQRVYKIRTIKLMTHLSNTYKVCKLSSTCDFSTAFSLRKIFCALSLLNVLLVCEIFDLD